MVFFKLKREQRCSLSILHTIHLTGGFNFLFLFLLLDVLLFSPAFSQSPVSFNYSVENGLPSSETYGILKDSKGYIWVATDRGVCRYDGYNFQVFTTHDGLTDNTVFNLFEDKEGRIWFTSFNGTLSYYKDGKIHAYENNSKLIAHGFQSQIIRSFLAKHDTVFFGSLVGGVFAVLPGGEIHDLALNRTPGTVGYYFKEFQNTLLFGSYAVPKSSPGARHELIFDGFGKKIEIECPKFSMVQQNCTAVKRKNGRVVLYCPGKICEIDPGGKIYEMDTREDVVKIIEDRDSCIWISTKKKGIKRFRPNEWINTPEADRLFEDETITDVCFDHEGGLWLSSLDNGIYFIPNLNYRVFPPGGKADVTCLISDSAGNIFYGTKDGFVRELSFKGTTLTGEVPFPAGKNTSIYSLYLDKKNNLYLGGSLGSGVICNGTFRSIEGQSCRSIIVRERTRELLTLNFAELVIRSADPPGKISVFSPVSFHSDIAFYDGNGQLWVGGNTGLFFLKGDSLEPAADPIFRSRISDINELPGGKLVLGLMGKGVIIWDRKSKPLVIDERSGLCNNLVNGLAVSGDTIWAATSNGLSRIIYGGQRMSISNYNTNNGLPTTVLRKVIVAGRFLWLATARGLVRVETGKMMINHSSAPVYISSVEVNNMPLQKGNGDTLELPYDYDILKIGFTGLCYKQKGKIDYEYDMEGLTTGREKLSSNYVQFTSLDPGNYTFRVYAQNDAGRWSVDPAVLHLSIAAPYWQTWWFRILVAAILVGSVYAMVYYRIAQQRSRSRMLEMVNTYRLQALSSQMNPHFIFNILNTIQSLVMVEDRKNASRYLNKFSKLMRLELNNLRREYVGVEEEVEMLKLYLELEQLRFPEKFDYHVVVDPSIGSTILIPTMLIQPLVENAVRHGIMNLQDRKGVITVTLQMESNCLFCTIDDNGVGREKSAIFREKDHVSAGLNITMQRLKLICQIINGPFFYFHITDKNLPTGEPSGTRIKFVVPVKK